jgi:hypothetical protein
MAQTPRPESLVFNSPVAARPEVARQPSWGIAATPITPGSRYLQPVQQAPRTEESRFKGFPAVDACPRPPTASLLDEVRRRALRRGRHAATTRARAPVRLHRRRVRWPAPRARAAAG